MKWISIFERNATFTDAKKTPKPFRIFYRHLAVTINKCNYRWAHSLPNADKPFIQNDFVTHRRLFLFHRYQVDSFYLRLAHKLNRIFGIVHEGTVDPIVYYFQSIFISCYETITLKYGHNISKWNGRKLLLSVWWLSRSCFQHHAASIKTNVSIQRKTKCLDISDIYDDYIYFISMKLSQGNVRPFHIVSFCVTLFLGSCKKDIRMRFHCMQCRAVIHVSFHMQKAISQRHINQRKLTFFSHSKWLYNKLHVSAILIAERAAFKSKCFY